MGIFIIGRVKSPESIIEKLNRMNERDNGNFPINKCLNDILGYRIIDNNYNNNINGIIKLIERFKEEKFRIKPVDRNLDSYKAYHIYFRGGSNMHFPIELQLWDKKDELSNRESHKKHKQSYIDKMDKFNEI